MADKWIVLAWPLTLCACFVVTVGSYFLVLLVHQIYFGLLPERAIRRSDRTNDERLRRHLERVVATPAPLGDHHKLIIRSTLAGIYLPRGEHALAEAQLRANLITLARYHHLTKFAAVEASTRRRLADCLEALGRPGEAEEQRRLAVVDIEEAPDDPVRFLTRGTFLERANRHSEAYESFEQALMLTDESNRPVRLECMIHLVLAANNSGRPLDCLRWAEEAIRMGAEGAHLISAHRMAGVACSNLSRLDESADHGREAHAAAIAAGDCEKEGETLAWLADVERQQGRLVKAYESARRAEAVAPESARIAISVQFEVLRHWGRFDEALAKLDLADKRLSLVIPHYERRMRAVYALTRARTHAEIGQGDLAWGSLQPAIAEFATDAKLGLSCATTTAWIRALQGQVDESRRVADEAEARLESFQDNPSTSRGLFYDLGIAATIRGDHGQAIRHWDRYFPLKPSPVYWPTAYYHRGEAHHDRGDVGAARADYRSAVGMNIDTHHARLAATRLREVGPA